MRNAFAPLAILGAVFLLPTFAFAAGPPLEAPLWSVAPFVALLLAIALLPLFAGHLWHRNAVKLLVALALSVPVIGLLVYLEQIENKPGMAVLQHALFEYVDFIILLAALYTVSGGVVLQARIRPSPLANSFFLGLGAVLANFIGTTGASMLLIRPVLRINRQRQYKAHVPIFFIFLVSNLGGLLTPLGDPPLFLGFLRGVDFFWTLQLAPQWLVANGLVLAVFFFWDLGAWLREPPYPELETDAEPEPIRLRGLFNFLFLAGIIGGVFLKQPHLANDITAWVRQYWQDCPKLPWGTLTMALMGFLSWLTTAGGLRRLNEFQWAPILEVGILFLGIFITMIPALEYLKLHDFGLTAPWEYFWLAGGLSSFLDNAPTYLTFATMASGSDDLGRLMRVHPDFLEAISCGAVFMGANTYIGNGPNFMVKAIADRSGYQTPSFLGYMLYSGFILLPVFGLVTYWFFWD